MPLIMRNGKSFCSSSSEAIAITYDNANSSLNSGSVQDAIDELSNAIIECATVEDMLDFAIDMGYANPIVSNSNVVYVGEGNVIYTL